MFYDSPRAAASAACLGVDGCGGPAPNHAALVLCEVAVGAQDVRTWDEAATNELAGMRAPPPRCHSVRVGSTAMRARVFDDADPALVSFWGPEDGEGGPAEGEGGGAAPSNATVVFDAAQARVRYVVVLQLVHGGGESRGGLGAASVEDAWDAVLAEASAAVAAT